MNQELLNKIRNAYENESPELGSLLKQAGFSESQLNELRNAYNNYDDAAFGAVIKAGPMQPQPLSPEIQQSLQSNEVDVLMSNLTSGNKGKTAFKLQSIFTDENQPQEMRLKALNAFHEIVPKTHSAIEMVGPNKYRAVKKSQARQVGDIVFGQEVIDRRMTDEGGLWEGTKSVADYTMGALDFPSRFIGGLVTGGPIQSEETYPFKEFSSSEDLKSARQVGRNTLRNSTKAIYERMLKQTDPEKQAKMIELINENIDDLAKLEEKSALEITEELGLRMLPELAGGLVKGGAKALEKLTKGIPDEAYDVLRYGKPELVKGADKLIDEGGIRTDVVEEAASTLVKPPIGVEDAGKAARDARYEDYNRLADMETSVLDERGVIDYKKLREDMAEQSEFGEIEDELLNTVMSRGSIRKAPEVVAETLSDVKGVTRPNIVSDKNAMGWDYLTSSESNADMLRKFLADNPPENVSSERGWAYAVFSTSPTKLLDLAEKTDPKYATKVNDYISTFNTTGKNTMMLESEKELSRIFNSNAKPALRKLASNVLDQFKKTDPENLTTRDINSLTSKIDETLRGMDGSDAYFNEFKQLSNNLKSLKKGAVEGVLENVPSRYIKNNLITSIFTSKKPFKESFRELSDSIKNISSISESIVKKAKLGDKSSNLTNAEWQTVTEKMNKYIKDAIGSKNTSVVKNARKNLKELGDYLKGKEIDFDLADNIEKYEDIVKYAKPKFNKKGNIVGYKIVGEDANNMLIDAIKSGPFEKMFNGLVSNVARGASDRVINSFLNSERATKLINKLADKTGYEPSVIRRIAKHAISARKVPSKVTKSTRDDKPESPTTLPSDISLSGQEKN